MKKVAFYAMISINLLLVTSCGSDKIKDEPIQAIETENYSINEIHESELTNYEGGTIVQEGGSKDKDEEFSHELYFQSEEYSIAPSELSIKDLNRPEDNSEWIKSLVVRYPQIYNLKNRQKQKRINDFLYNKVISYHNILSEREYINYTLDYEIMTGNDEMFSILFYGEVSDYRTENGFAFATTFNLESEEEGHLKEYISINDSFIEDYMFTRFNVIENNFEDVQENIPFIEQYVLSYNDDVHVNDFYIKDNTIGIIIPTYNSMGYILIEGDIE